MEKINSDTCFDKFHPKNSNKPQDWDTMKENGICVKGRNQVFSNCSKKCFVKKKFFFQIACNGDSGSPTIWEDKDDNKRAYLMGIINGAPFR